MQGESKQQQEQQYNFVKDYSSLSLLFLPIWHLYIFQTTVTLKKTLKQIKTAIKQ